MKTSVMEVRDMLSVLSALGVEKRIGAVPGVESVTVNYAAGTATVRYDETRLEVSDIKSDVRQNGFEEAETGAAGPAGTGHKDHATPSAAQASPASSAPNTPPVAPAAVGADSSSAAQPDKAASEGVPPAASKPSPDTAGDGKKGKTP